MCPEDPERRDTSQDIKPCALWLSHWSTISVIFFFIPNRHIHSISAKEFILLFWTHQTDAHSNEWEITRRTKAKTYSVFCWMFELIRRKETVSFGGGVGGGCEILGQDWRQPSLLARARPEPVQTLRTHTFSTGSSSCYYPGDFRQVLWHL